MIAGYTNNEQVLAYMEATDDQKTEGELSPENFEMMITDEFSSVIRNPNENSTCELKPEMVTNAVLFFYKPYPPTINTTVFRDRYLNFQTEKNFAAGLTLLAGKVARHKSKKAFVYRFDYRPKTQSVMKDVPEWAGVPHMFELPFVWGLTHLTGSNITQWQYNDKKQSEIIMLMLTIFAKSGNPSITSYKWEPFTQENPRILIIDKNIEMDKPNMVDYKALAFWNDYYPLVVEDATNICCNVTNTATTWKIFFHNMCFNGVIVIATLYRLCL